MKRFRVALVAAGLSLGAAGAQAVEVGDDLTRLPLPSGDLKGHVTLVNFWATWCAACKVELAEMAKAFAPLVGDQRLTLAFVSLDKDPADSRRFLAGGMTDPQGVVATHLYADPQFALADKLGVDAFPFTLVIGADGKVLKIQRGYEEGSGSVDGLAQLIQTQLKGGNPS